MLDDQGRSESENPVIPENEENPEDSGISGKTPQPKRRGGFIRATLLASRAGSSVREEMKHIRLSHLRYMLIFSLAPIFPNMKNSLIADRVLGLDGVYAMGIAYCLGLGLLFLVRNTDKLARFARRLALITAAFSWPGSCCPRGCPPGCPACCFPWAWAAVPGCPCMPSPMPSTMGSGWWARPWPVCFACCPR